MRIGTTYKEKESTSESLALKGRMECDQALRQSLTDPEEGMLRPGALPKISTASASGNKAILDSLGKVGQLGFGLGWTASKIGNIKWDAT